MVRAARSKDPPDKFLTDKSKKDQENSAKDLSNIGVGSERKKKNRNPDLEIID